MNRNKGYLLPDISRPGKVGCRLPELDVPEAKLPPREFLRQELALPEVSETELVRYFTLSLIHISEPTRPY